MDNLEKAKQLYIAKKYKESFSLFKGMADSAEVSYYLGMHYLEGHGVKQNDDKAFAYFKAAWEGLFHEGIYMLGRMYEEGRGTKENPQQAFRLYEAATESLNAKLRLAKMYEQGQVVDQDLSEAIKLYNACQKLGSAYAMYKIGRFYLMGKGLKKNLKNGYAWLQKALAENHILAVNYFRLIGKKPSSDNRTTDDILQQAKAALKRGDQEYALSFLEVCLAEKSVQALHLIVDHYLSGHVFAKDTVKAFKLLLNHQDMDDPSIDYRLGTFYEQGLGVLSSYYKASLFYEKAANQGHQAAKEALTALRGY